jgi:hypothetical protein
MPKEEFTAQGKYLWSLVKQAGWDRQTAYKKPELRITNYELKESNPIRHPDNMQGSAPHPGDDCRLKSAATVQAGTRPAPTTGETPVATTEKKLSRFEAYLLKTFRVTHMNALGVEEMRRAIRTLKPYADKARHDACKGIRQNIMAICTTYGWDKDELHSHMKVWKYGESLRELGYNELIAVRGHVRAALCRA